MDVKDKEMTIELENVSEEGATEQAEESSDKKQHHKRKGGCFKTVMLAFAMVIVVGVSFFAGRQSVMTSSGFGTGLNNGTILRKLSLLEAYTGKYYLNKIDADNVEQNIYKGFAKGLQDPYAEYYTKEEFKQLTEEDGGNYRFEYSPESFTGTELDFALEICTAVQKTWGATKENPIIINLPSTVEMNTPNVYADQIEWMNRHFENRESIILSIHPHNDRGTGVASAELALLAGAERVEGTLFGNGERTGNVDVLNIAYNMFSQGINPELEIGHVNDIIGIYERCCKIPIHPRHPYAGKLVFTAFSGSHQDAINKGVQAMKERKSEIWQVPYLPIDPADIGREYEPIVRINSQSGKGGVAFVMDTYFGFKLPKAMHKEFANVIQKISEKQGEVSPQQIMDNFKREYLDQKEPLHFKKLRIEDLSGDAESGEFDTKVIVDYTLAGKPGTFDAVGNGPIDAVKRGLQVTFGMNIRVLDYEEHALQNGSNAQAAAYIHMMDAESGRVTYGVGVSSNITRASVRAMFSAVNRLELVTGV